MPNKKAKDRKQKRKKLNEHLKRYGRTPKQIARVKKKQRNG